MALSLPPLASLRGLAAAALCAGLLAGCGSALTGMVPGMAGNSRVDLDKVSRDKLEKFGTPILRATVPALGKDLLDVFSGQDKGAAFDQRLQARLNKIQS